MFFGLPFYSRGCFVCFPRFSCCFGQVWTAMMKPSWSHIEGVSSLGPSCCLLPRLLTKLLISAPFFCLMAKLLTRILAQLLRRLLVKLRIRLETPFEAPCVEFFWRSLMNMVRNKKASCKAHNSLQLYKASYKASFATPYESCFKAP